MGHDSTEFDRLLAGSVGSDDVTLGRTAAFLDHVRTTQPLPDVAALEAEHLTNARAALAAPNGSPRFRRSRRLLGRSRRILVAAVVGVVAGLSASVGVAAAFGVNPIETFTHLQLVPGPATSAPQPPAGSEPNQRSEGDDPAAQPSTSTWPTDVPRSSNAPTAKPTPGSNGRSKDSPNHPSPTKPTQAATGNGSDKNKSKEKKPTTKPTTAQNDKAKSNNSDKS